MQLPQHEPDDQHDAEGEAAEHLGREPAAIGTLDHPEEERAQPDDRQQRAEHVEAADTFVPRLRDRREPDDDAAATMGTFTRKIEPHQKSSSRIPPMTGPMARPAAPNTANAAIAGARSSGG